MRQVLRAGVLGRPRGMGCRRRLEGGSGWGTHVNPWLIYVNVWQNPLQHYKVISLQRIKIHGKKKCLDPQHTISKRNIKWAADMPPPHFSSVQFSCSVVSDSLWTHGLQHTRLPCPSPNSRAYSSSCPLSQWCYPTVSSSVIPFSSHLQSFPTSGPFPMSQFFASGGQSTGVSASTSVLPMNIQDWFPLGWTGWISLLPKGLSTVFSNTTVQKHQFFRA